MDKAKKARDGAKRERRKGQQFKQFFLKCLAKEHWAGCWHSCRSLYNWWHARTT